MTPREDEELEHVLRRYEPVGPPASLRTRVLGGQTSVRRAWPWVAAAAALLALTISLHEAAGRRMASEPRDSAMPLTADVLVDMMGGGEEAHAISMKIVALDESARQNAVPVATSGANGDAQ